jgi:hypothetical protein
MGMSLGSVREHNYNMLEVLARIRREVQKTGTVELTPAFHKTVMGDLRRIGLSAYTSLGDGLFGKLDGLEEKAAAPGLALTIKSDTFPLLWEMLYTGPSRGVVQMERFWGFRHRISRFQLGANVSEEEEIYPDSDFLFCHNHQLGHWRAERDVVRQLVSSHFRFRLLDEVISRPGEAGLSGGWGERFIDVLALPELGMLHLACHCLPCPGKSGALSSELVISWQSSSIRVKLLELQAARRDFGFSLQPLVFLNACKTMTNPDLLIQGDSFPGSFLRFGASGVIATACDVPDQFAAAFSAKFYENLLVNVAGRSPTVSEALLKTRQFFIRPPYYNPLGLAYGLYARNDLHIEWEPWADYEEKVAHGKS